MSFAFCDQYSISSASIVATLLSLVSAPDDRKAYILRQANDGSTALMLASRNGHESTVKCLLGLFDTAARQAYILQQNKYGLTAMMIASQKGHESTVKCILDSLDPAVRQSCIFHQDNGGRSALMVASRYGQESTVKCLLDSLDPHARQPYTLQQNKYGWTALMLASEHGHESIVKCLLDSIEPAARQSCISQQTNDGETALMRASRYGHESTVKCLLDSLHPAARQSCISHQTNDGRSTLMIASDQGHESTVKCLLDSIDPAARQSYIFHQDNDGWTALMSACQKGKESTVRCLIDSLDPAARQSCISQQNKNGVTALILASRNGHESIVKCLLDSIDPAARQSCIFQQDKDGRTALMPASRYGHESIVKRLLDSLDSAARQSHIFHQDNDGCTALMLACEKNHVSIALLLLSFLDVEARYAYILQHNGRQSALYFASDRDSRDLIATILVQKQFTQSSDHDHRSHNHSLRTLLLQELFSAQQFITPEDYRQDIIFRTFLGYIANKHDPSLALQCLRLMPHDVFFTLHIPINLLADMKFYIRALFFEQRSEGSLAPQPQVLTCLMQILNWLCIRHAPFTKDILSSIISMPSSARKPQDQIAWTFLRNWCQVLHVMCDYPSLREQYGQESDLQACISSLSNMHLDTSDTQFPAHDSPGFVPLKATTLQFVHHWQLYLQCANEDEDSPSFPAKESIYATFWCEFGSVMDVIPITFLRELSRDICAHLGEYFQHILATVP